MSILIKGMEMPTSCGDCRFCGGIADTDCGPCAWCDVDGKARVADTRQDCPLVPVPAHGDLIDRDAILMAYELSTSKVDCSGCKYKNEVRCPKYELCEALNDAPIIIPPSGGKEDE